MVADNFNSVILHAHYSEVSFIDTSITQMGDMIKRIEHLSLGAVAVLRPKPKENYLPLPHVLQV